MSLRPSWSTYSAQGYIVRPVLKQTVRSPTNLGNRTKDIVHSNVLFNIKCTVKPPPLPQAPLTCPFPPSHPPILPPSHWVQSGYYGLLECWLILLTWPFAGLIHVSMAVESSWLQWQRHVQRTTFHSTLSHLSFFTSFFCSSPWVLGWNADIGDPFKNESLTLSTLTH